MSVLVGASRIQDKHGTDYRLQIGGRKRWEPMYRVAKLNGWHCGHWHATPEDALACAVSKGAPM